MKMKKHMMILIAIVTMTMLLMSCGSTEESKKTTENTTKEKVTTKEELTSESGGELNLIYSELSDEEFKLLTEMIAKSFYTFRVDHSDFEILESNPKVMNCLTSLYDYATENGFDLDPGYCAAFALKYEVVSTISNYDILKEKFMVTYYRDSRLGKWVYKINSYSLNQEDIVRVDEVMYIDAEGYLAPGVIVYWEEDGKMVPVGEIEEIAYNKQIYDMFYPYAIKVDYYDDPEDTGWNDGEMFLLANKKATGKPLYYIEVLDVNRRIIKEEIDFSGDTIWVSIADANLSVGTEVYLGSSSAKGLLFTILKIDKENDLILVQYPSGSTEYKSYSYITNHNQLFVK